MQFRIPSSHPSLAGHFPGRPIVPGVVLLDVAIAAIEARHPLAAPLRLPQVKFLQPLLPEQDAELQLDETGPWRWKFRILRGDTLLVSGEVAGGAGA